MNSEKKRELIAKAYGWRKEFIHGNGLDCDVYVDSRGLVYSENFDIEDTNIQEIKNVLIAQACGWKQKSSHFNCGLGIWMHEGKEYTRIPDYFNDLNAIHEAIKTLSHVQKHEVEISQFFRYQLRLGVICNTSFPTEATASQRAEAFGKTLGLWE